MATLSAFMSACGGGLTTAAWTALPTAAWTALPTAATSSEALSVQLLCAVIVGSWLGQVTQGYWSYVDRLWSIVPALYALVFAALHQDNPRLCVMGVLACAWGARLSANFARKGGFSGEEDYRWAIIRDWFGKNDPTHPVGRELFSFAFVAVYQHVLIWMISAPASFIVLHASSSALLPLDYVLMTAFLGALLLETVTDEQQWAFQSLKHSLSPAQRKLLGGDYVRGFCTTGVFSLSRHLNFFCEQAMWWVFYGFTVAAGADRLNWSAAGPILLTLLFCGSTAMTERISVSKYPAYRAYQRTTSVLIPWFAGVPLDSAEGQALVESVTAVGAANTKAENHTPSATHRVSPRRSNKAQ